MRKSDILKEVNTCELWEKQGKLIELLEKDDRLGQEKKSTFCYSVPVKTRVHDSDIETHIIYYSSDCIIFYNNCFETGEYLDFTILNYNPDLNNESNRRRKPDDMKKLYVNFFLKSGKEFLYCFTVPENENSSDVIEEYIYNYNKENSVRICDYDLYRTIAK